MKYCSNCGNPSEDDVKFCQTCGTVLPDENSGSVSEPPSQESYAPQADTYQPEPQDAGTVQPEAPAPQVESFSAFGQDSAPAPEAPVQQPDYPAPQQPYPQDPAAQQPAYSAQQAPQGYAAPGAAPQQQPYGQPQQPYGQQPQYGQPQYGQPAYAGAPVAVAPKSNKNMIIVIVLVAVVAAVGIWFFFFRSGGGGSLSAEAKAMVNTVSAGEQQVATRGLLFIEAVNAGNAKAVEQYMHPDMIAEANAIGISGSSPGDIVIQYVKTIIGPSATGYERINIDLYSGGRADCDVYFVSSWDFIVIEMELFNGEYYVVNFY